MSAEARRMCVLGAGLMGAQIGCEYALAGHDVTLFVRDLGGARRRVDEGIAVVVEHGLCNPDAAADGRRRIAYATDLRDAVRDPHVIVESLPEDLSLKAGVLRRAAAAAPDALIASNTSSLRITELGRAIGAGARTVGTHYWNPPLLMPLVEVVAGEDTDPKRFESATRIVAQTGKTPVNVERDVPGFVWNRLQMAIVREAISLVETGVVSAEDLDLVVKDGLARRWRQIGPLRAIGLGGIATWNAACREILPDLSKTDTVPNLAQFAIESDDPQVDVRERDRGLAADLLAERQKRRD